MLVLRASAHQGEGEGGPRGPPDRRRRVRPGVQGSVFGRCDPVVRRRDEGEPRQHPHTQRPRLPGHGRSRRGTQSVLSFQAHIMTEPQRQHPPEGRDEALFRPIEETGRGYYITVGVLLAIIIWAAYMYLTQLRTGLSVTG